MPTMYNDTIQPPQAAVSQPYRQSQKDMGEEKIILPDQPMNFDIPELPEDEPQVRNSVYQQYLDHLYDQGEILYKSMGYPHLLYLQNEEIEYRSYDQFSTLFNKIKYLEQVDERIIFESAKGFIDVSPDRINFRPYTEKGGLFKKAKAEPFTYETAQTMALMAARNPAWIAPNKITLEGSPLERKMIELAIAEQNKTVPHEMKLQVSNPVDARIFERNSETPLFKRVADKIRSNQSSVKNLQAPDFRGFMAEGKEIFQRLLAQENAEYGSSAQNAHKATPGNTFNNGPHAAKQPDISPQQAEAETVSAPAAATPAAANANDALMDEIDPGFKQDNKAPSPQTPPANQEKPHIAQMEKKLNANIVAAQRDRFKDTMIDNPTGQQIYRVTFGNQERNGKPQTLEVLYVVSDNKAKVVFVADSQYPDGKDGLSYSDEKFFAAIYPNQALNNSISAITTGGSFPSKAYDSPYLAKTTSYSMAKPVWMPLGETDFKSAVAIKPSAQTLEEKVEPFKGKEIIWDNQGHHMPVTFRQLIVNEEVSDAPPMARVEYNGHENNVYLKELKFETPQSPVAKPNALTPHLDL